MVEGKVKAAGYTAALVTIILHLLNFIPAVAGMPDGVKSSLATVVTGLVVFAAGYLAQHTPRPDLEHKPKHAADPEVGAVDALTAAVIAFLVVVVLILLLKFL